MKMHLPARQTMTLVSRWYAWCVPLVLLGIGVGVGPIGVEPAVAAADLVAGFQDPPASTKPWCYWYWISDNISKDGITRDLEAMARVGIGEALIGNIFLEDVPSGDIKVLSDAWWELIEHAIREGGRVGVNIGMFNCPGWSQSGGPWIEPGQAMRYLVWSETRVRGPQPFSAALATPCAPFQDVAVLAVPVPEADGDRLAEHRPQITCVPAVEPTTTAVDGRLDTALVFPPHAGTGKGVFTIEIGLPAPLTARHLALTPAEGAWAADCELQAAAEDGTFRTVRRFRFDRSNMETHVGPMPRGPVAIAFPAVAADRFRILFTAVTGSAALAEIDLAPAARLESYVEKQLGKMHPTPLPQWDTYMWPPSSEPEQNELAVSVRTVQDLSGRMTPNGRLQWDVPAGNWVVLRIGMTTTGTRNSPASPEGQGLEVDKMNRQALQGHFDAFIGAVLRRMEPKQRTAFKHVVADSYEMGSQNWTDGFADIFQERYGYNPVPWLPVLTGRIVGSADQSDRFLWDLRRLVADQIARDYVGGLRDLCHTDGLRLWLENYGHWGFPAEFLQYGGQSDFIGGEFWTKGSLGSIECRAASSAANIYGKPFVSAEAFTSSPSEFDTVPADLKARGDWCFCEGINHLVLHVCIHQPWEDRWPGVNAWFGTEFNRHNTWFEPGRAWIDYLRSCCFLLQQGTRVADVAYFIGEDTPKMTGTRQPELPPGCDFDYINAEVILHSMSVQDGRLVLPHGTAYQVLVLPEQQTMRPELLQKIGQLVEAGATVVGRPPVRSPSMQGHPQCDAEVKRLAAEVWGPTPGRESAVQSHGQGQVIWGEPLDQVLDRLGVGPDFRSQPQLRYTHRTTGAQEIYFVANPEPQDVVAIAEFRVGDRAPELWWPVTRVRERPAVYDQSGATVRLPLVLGPRGSVFVVFGDAPAAASRIVTVSRQAEKILDATVPAGATTAAQPQTGPPASNFTLAMWVRPSADTTILPQFKSGVHGMADPRNDLVYPTHGSEFGGSGHAGCGVAVGRNGVCVFEHGANYFAPPLVYEAVLAGWTHVAVVYRDNQPRLYLDGKPVHIGLRSDRIVHPGSAVATFAGQAGAIRQMGRALDDREVAGLSLSMPRPDTLLPARAVQLTASDDGAIRARFWQNGNFTLENGQGRTQTVQVTGVLDPLAVAGPWQVVFQPPQAMVLERKFDRLTDWTESSDEAVRCFSGRATYRTTFSMPQTPQGRPVRLDLGEVRGLATVRLNGHDLGTLWMEPWQIDVTAAVQIGQNVLEVDVVNTWRNRLVGDAKLPPEQRHTYLRRPINMGNLPLQSAGLLGPVSLSMAEEKTWEVASE